MNEFLLENYQKARYVVETEDCELELRVGQCNAKFNALIEQQESRQSIFITAFNPQSKLYPLAINRENNEKLLTAIKTGGYRYWDGYGQDDEKKWPKEESFVVLDIKKEDADELAHRFCQNAYLLMTIDSPVELIIAKNISQ